MVGDTENDFEEDELNQFEWCWMKWGIGIINVFHAKISNIFLKWPSPNPMKPLQVNTKPSVPFAIRNSPSFLPSFTPPLPLSIPLIHRYQLAYQNQTVFPDKCCENAKISFSQTITQAIIVGFVLNDAVLRKSLPFLLSAGNDAVQPNHQTVL